MCAPVPRPRPAGSRRARRAPPRAARPSARGCRAGAGSRSRAAGAPRQRESRVALRPREHLDRERHAAERHDPLGGRPATARAAHGDVAGGRSRSIGATRFEPQRSCSLDGVGGLAVLLVGGDRLVLDPVVGGEVAAAQRGIAGSMRSPRRPRPRAPTERAAPGLPPAPGRQRRRADRAERPHVLHRQLRASGSARLTSGMTANASASFVTPRTPGHALGRASTRTSGLRPDATLISPVLRRARRRPSASARARAARCAAPCRPAAASRPAPARRSSRAPSARARRRSAPPGRGPRPGSRSSAPWISGAASNMSISAPREEAVGDAVGERLAEPARVGEARQHRGRNDRHPDPRARRNRGCGPSAPSRSASGCRSPARRSVSS